MTTAPGVHVEGDLLLADAPLIRNLDLALVAGGWSCLLGPSGVGKSTLGRLIAGLSGPFHLHGACVASDGVPLQGRVAMMAQDGQLLPWASVLHNVTIGARLRGQVPDVARARALLGWQPALDIGDAARLTAEWYRAAREGGDMLAITRAQIADYRAALARGQT